MNTPSFDGRPRVAACLNNREDLAALPDIPLAEACDILEIRLDGLDPVGREEIDSAIADRQVEVLLTARSSNEGGFREWDWPEREASIGRHLAPGRWIDLEWSTLDSIPEARDAAKRWLDAGHPLIVSRHDFNGVPGIQALDDETALAAEFGAAVYKAAVTPRSLSAFSRFLSWFDRRSPIAKAAMAMGPFGATSRFLFASAGSAINYGYLRHPSVPGQVPASALMQALREAFGPPGDRSR